MSGIGAQPIALRAPNEIVNRPARGFSLDVPERDIDGGHGMTGYAVAAEQKGGGRHAIPGSRRIGGIDAGQGMGKAAHHLVHVGCADDRIDDRGHAVGFAKAHHAGNRRDLDHKTVGGSIGALFALTFKLIGLDAGDRIRQDRAPFSATGSRTG